MPGPTTMVVALSAVASQRAVSWRSATSSIASSAPSATVHPLASPFDVGKNRWHELRPSMKTASIGTQTMSFESRSRVGHHCDFTICRIGIRFPQILNPWERGSTLELPIPAGATNSSVPLTPIARQSPPMRAPTSPQRSEVPLPFVTVSTPGAASGRMVAQVGMPTSSNPVSTASRLIPAAFMRAVARALACSMSIVRYGVDVGALASPRNASRARGSGQSRTLTFEARRCLLANRCVVRSARPTRAQREATCCCAAH